MPANKSQRRDKTLRLRIGKCRHLHVTFLRLPTRERRCRCRYVGGISDPGSMYDLIGLKLSVGHFCTTAFSTYLHHPLLASPVPSFRSFH